ncbi:MAG: hypothetical protein ACE5FF_05825 [Saprospiraceae bacterium]
MLQNIGAGWEHFPYLHIIVFPLFIFLLPLRTPRALVILLGFILGLLIDTFYNSMGVHASAAVFTAFIRPYVLRRIEPRGGYNVNYSPTAARWGIGWFLKYSAILLFLHLFFYFSVEAFTFVYIVDIMLKTIVSFIFSMICVIVYQVIFNPVN